MVSVITDLFFLELGFRLQFFPAESDAQRHFPEASHILQEHSQLFYLVNPIVGSDMM